MNLFILYIDPGSGSFLFQLLIAGGLAVSFYFKKIRETLLKWFRAFFYSPDKPE
ncbi:MAG: hypothetical protein SF052_04720 [Bacteroidia bacterium]|nr:hypothetical protein [Bacteroidia bacterium]